MGSKKACVWALAGILGIGFVGCAHKADSRVKKGEIAQTLDSPKAENSEYIEFDGIGRRVAYHFLRRHPGDITDPGLAGETVRVPAESVLHIVDPVDAGQLRGVSRFSPALVALLRTQSSNLRSGCFFSKSARSVFISAGDLPCITS